MRRILFAVLAIITTVLSILSIWTWVVRWRLPYDAEGNYFDPADQVVYHDQAVVVYGLIAAVALLLTVLFVVKATKNSCCKGE